MKFGAHSYIFIDHWSDDCLPILDRAAELGLDILDIGIGDDLHFAHAPVRRRAEDLGLDLAVSPGGLWPLECDLSSEDPADRAAGLAYHKRQVDVAAGIGAVAYGGSLYGHTGVVKRRRPPAHEYPRTAEGLHKLAEYAAERGVVIALEPMSHFRTHLVNTPEQVMRLVGLANHDNLKVLLDTYHLVTEVTDYADGIRVVGDRLWGLHACENNRGVPGSGIIPWEDIFKALAETGFDGYVVMESYNSSLGDFAFERGMFHNVCPDSAAFVTNGLSFLKSGLRKAGALTHRRYWTPSNNPVRNKRPTRNDE